MKPIRSTTVLLVRRAGKTVMASDGQVTLSDTIVKSTASKVKRAGKGGSVLVGFAGGAADGLALYTRFEGKLDEYQGNLERAVVELAKDWRTDRVLRQLQAMMIIADHDQSFLMSGTGDLIQPDEERLPAGEGSPGRKGLRAGEGVLAIGSGSNYALAAARALMRHTELSPREIVEEAMGIAAEICIYTNDRLTIEEL